MPSAFLENELHKKYEERLKSRSHMRPNPGKIARLITTQQLCFSERQCGFAADAGKSTFGGKMRKRRAAVGVNQRFSGRASLRWQPSGRRFVARCTHLDAR